MTTDTSAEALEESIFWLKAKYHRHGEIEDRIAAEQLEYFQAEKRRAREGVMDVAKLTNRAYMYTLPGGAAGDMSDGGRWVAIEDEEGVFICIDAWNDIRAALESVWPDGRDAKDAARYRWLRTHFRFANDSMHEVWFDASLEPNDSGVPADLDMEIDAAMKESGR